MRRTALFLILALILSVVLGFGSQMLVGLLGGSVDSALSRQTSNALVVLGPALAAIILARQIGSSIGESVRRDFREMLFSWWWLAIPPATLLLTLLAFDLAGSGSTRLIHALSDVQGVAWQYGFSILVVGILEEIGWRGWLLRQ